MQYSNLSLTYTVNMSVVVCAIKTLLITPSINTWSLPLLVCNLGLIVSSPAYIPSDFCKQQKNPVATQDIYRYGLSSGTEGLKIWWNSFPTIVTATVSR